MEIYSLENSCYCKFVFRINAAGFRSGMFDSIFFGMRAFLSGEEFSLSPALVYGISAISAASADYLVDVSVKRMMRVEPHYPVPGILSMLKNMVASERILDLHRGLASKVLILFIIVYSDHFLFQTAEMGISYAVTGFFSVYITHYFYAYLMVR